MNQHDYVILCNEKGTPYIAHADSLVYSRNMVPRVSNQAKGVGQGVRTRHKYILKVNENGNTRYFYNQEEVRAYYEAKRNGIKNAAEYAQNAVKNVTPGAADAANTVKKTVKANEVRYNVNNAVRNAKDAYERMKSEFIDRTKQAKKEDKSKGIADPNEHEYHDAAKQVSDDKNSQEQAPINSKNTNNVAKTERARREVLGEFREAIDKEKKLIRKVESFENGLKDKYGDNWHSEVTKAERNNLLALRKQRAEAYQETQKDKYWDAYYNYYNSPLGRLERARKNKNKQV